MTITGYPLSLDPSHFNSPDLLGEVLRDTSFQGRYGCYSCFDLHPRFQPVAPDSHDARLVLKTMCATWHGGESEADHILSEYDVSFFSDGTLRVGWYWDGDGTLAFATPQFGLVNDDCKKERGWTLTSFNPRVINIHRLKLEEEAGGLTAHQRLAYLGDPDYGSLNAAILGLLGLHYARLNSFETLAGQAISTVKSLALLALSPAANPDRIHKAVEPIANEVSHCIGKYRKARDRVALEASLRYLEMAVGKPPA